MEYHETEKAFPIISVDINYGKEVDDFDVDAEAMGEYLESRGVSQDDISNLSINFTPDYKSKEKVAKRGRTLAAYIKKDQTISVYRPSVLFSYTAPLTAQEALVFADAHEDNSKSFHINSNTSTSDQLNQTLTHEFEHHIDEVSGKYKEVDKVQDKLLVKAVAKTSIKYSLASMGTGVAIWTGGVLASDSLVDALEAQGDNATIVGLSINILALSAAILSARKLNRLGDIEHTKLIAAAYQKDRGEIKARLAEDTYQNDFVSVKLKPKLRKTVQEAVMSAARSAGMPDTKG